MRTVKIALAIPLLVAVGPFFDLGCDEESDLGFAATDDTSTGNICLIEQEVSYTGTMKEVFDQNCISCHSTANSGPDRNDAPVGVNFNTYDDAIDNADKANSRVQAGTMPPTAPLDSCTNQAFQGWIDNSLEE